jgi:transcriptional regulator with XRE-family HTH domain
MLLGKILKHIRVFGNYTQSELAEKIDISSSYISEIETDKKIPTIDILQKYSNYFDIPLSAIMLFAEEYDNKSSLKKKAKSFLTKTTTRLLDWICKEDEKNNLKNK